MHQPLTTDFLAAEAQLICAAAGRPELQLIVSDTRLRNGSHQYQFIAFAAPGETVFNEQVGNGLSAVSAQQALERLATSLGTCYPIPLASTEQQQQLIRLLNQPEITREEKEASLPLLASLTTVQAQESIAQLRVTIVDRRDTPYGVVGSAEVIAPSALAA